MKIAQQYTDYKSPQAKPSSPEQSITKELLSGPSTAASHKRGVDVALSKVAESLKIGQEALQTKLGEKLTEAFDKLGVDLNAAVGVDYSPGAVSDRITDFAGTMFKMYRNGRNDLSDEEAVDRFESLFTGGVSQGYSEAMDLLEGMKMPEEVLDVSRETKDLIDSKLDDLFSKLRGGAEEREDHS